MRYAVVVAPPGFVVPSEGSLFTAPEPVGPVCATLARGGRRVVLVQTSPDLAHDFSNALAPVGTEDDLVVYIAAMITTRADAVALRVGGDSDVEVQLNVLGDAVVALRPSAVLFVIEAYDDGDKDDPLLAAEHVDATVRALRARERGYGVLIGLRPKAGAGPIAWPFTRHVLAALDDPASHDESGAARISHVYEQLRADSGAVPVQSFAFVRGHIELVIVEGGAESGAPPTSAAPAHTPPSASQPVPAHAQAAAAATLPGRQRSLPAIEPILDLADDARERGALDEALAGYKAALMVVAPDDARSRVSIYAHIGQVKRAQGKAREAELNFEKALSIDPKHGIALSALIELATEGLEVRRAVGWRRKRVQTLAGADERVVELRAIAEVCASQLQDPHASLEMLDEALGIAGKSRQALEGLQSSYEKLQAWERVVELLLELAQTSQPEAAKEKAALRYAAADVALRRLGDEKQGRTLLERALDDNPTQDQALHALVAVHTSHREWGAIEATYAGLVSRLAASGEGERAWEVSRKLGVLRRDKFHDAAGAIDAFGRAVHFRPDDLDSRAMLAEMHLAASDEPQAVVEFERIAQRAPTRSSAYVRLFGLHRRAGRTDQAWLTGSALEELGTADMDQQLFVDQYRGAGPIRPSRALDDAAWDELLRASGADDVVASLLRAVVATATATRLDDLRHAHKLVTLDASARQSATSTVSLVRSFRWAAQVLGVETPDLYVMDNVPGGIAAVQATRATTALGPDVLRGLTTKELAFLAGRHLTYYRPEHYCLICYPTLSDLSVLFLGAVKVEMADLEAPAHLRDGVSRMRKVLAKRASDEEKRLLGAAVDRLKERDGRVDLAAWIRGVELTAQRAGLLLCGDLLVATARLRGETETRSIAELTFEEKRADLLAFGASKKLARARALLGVDAHRAASVPPGDTLQVG